MTVMKKSLNDDDDDYDDNDDDVDNENRFLWKVDCHRLAPLSTRLSAINRHQHWHSWNHDDDDEDDDADDDDDDNDDVDDDQMISSWAGEKESRRLSVKNGCASS